MRASSRLVRAAWIGVLVALLGPASCGDRTDARFAQVRPGMDEAAVRDLLGDPLLERPSGMGDEGTRELLYAEPEGWLETHLPFLRGTRLYLVVSVERGAVVDTHTEGRAVPPGGAAERDPASPPGSEQDDTDPTPQPNNDEGRPEPEAD